MPSFIERLQHGWSAFRNNRDPTLDYKELGGGSSFNQSRNRMMFRNERTIINSISNKIAVDCSMIDLKHVKLNQNGRFQSICKSKLIDALTIEANIDQSGRALIKDIVISMFDEGVVAVVPTGANNNPFNYAFDPCEFRVCKILTWYPQHIRVRLYNDQTGRFEERIYPKRIAAIMENPFYEVMNAPNSVVQRLLRKLSLMDIVDEQTASGKLDLIFQFPHTIRSKDRVDEAVARIKLLEDQLTKTKLGIGYIDGTEKIIQLNRSLENNLQQQIEYLIDMLFSQLGVTKEILNNTASEQMIINYNNYVIAPIMNTIVDELTRKFITKTARTQGQAIRYFRDLFKNIPASSMAELADKFGRNEIMSPNEVRGEIGLMPSEDPAADQLRNRNLNQKEGETPLQMTPDGSPQAAAEQKEANQVSLDEFLNVPLSQVPSA